MASVIRKVALVGGSGHLGPYILQALSADATFDVTVITRHNSLAKFPTATKVVRVSDGYPDEEMVDIFKGQDAVVLCLGFAAQHRHAALAVASIKAGVKRLIASDYGGTNSNKEALKIFPNAAGKAKAIEELRAMETPAWTWTAICCGLFGDFSIKTGFLGYDPFAYTCRIWDTGDDKFSATNLATIGLAVAKVLTKPEETVNRSIYVSSFEWSLNQILDAYKKATGVADWTITKVNTNEEIGSAIDEIKTGSLKAMGKLALGTMIKRGCGSDFAAEGLLENELLGLPRESVEDTVARVLKNGLGTDLIYVKTTVNDL